MNEPIEAYLEGGDLRSVAGVGKLVGLIKSRDQFNDLFDYLQSSDRLVAMRAADAVEKVSAQHP